MKTKKSASTEGGGEATSCESEQSLAQPVWVPSKRRDVGNGKCHNTVCVSSQVGCKMGCTFCETGTMNLLGQLDAGEIAEQVGQLVESIAFGKKYSAVSQVFHASRICPVRNVVFMGMGFTHFLLSFSMAGLPPQLCILCQGSR